MKLLVLAIKWIAFFVLVGLVIYWAFFLGLEPEYQWYRDW